MKSLPSYLLHTRRLRDIRTVTDRKIKDPGLVVNKFQICKLTWIQRFFDSALIKKVFKCLKTFAIRRGEERAVKFLVSLIFSLFFSFLPNFFGRFSLLPDFSTFSLISLLRGLFYVLLHHSASFPHILKEGKHTKHVCHVVIFPCSHTTFRFCHVSLRL